MKTLNSVKIVNLVSMYNSLTPFGMALEGFVILQKLDNEVGNHELRETIFGWIN